MITRLRQSNNYINWFLMALGLKLLLTLDPKENHFLVGDNPVQGVAL